jgi:predicted flap endonuclease-1-like 5' DNA nuclease
MNIIAIFVLGLLIGWIIEWILDWFYWRGHIRKLANENTSLKEQITTLEEKLKKQSVISTPVTQRGSDDFQAIKGIGPVFSKRLKEAGIHTFEQLSKTTPKEMEKILGTLFKRFFSEDNTIIAQAKEYAERKAKKNG